MAVVKLNESENKLFRYRGYVIRKRESDGETRYDIINPEKDKKSPVWTDCGSMDEAKLWINSDIAGKDECLEESAEVNWTVKHFTFDAAIRGDSADSLGLNAGGSGKFFNDLCQFLAEHGMEMAGDYIDAEDVTDIYKDNDYEFFQSN